MDARKMVQAAKAAGFTISKMKSWETRDGVGTQATLKFNGKEAALYTQEGKGGACLLRWKEARGEAEKAFNAFLAGEDADIILSVLCDDLDLERLVKRAAKAGKTLVQNADGEVFAYKVAYTPDVAAKLKAKHPGCMILNEVYV